MLRGLNLPGAGNLAQLGLPGLGGGASGWESNIYSGQGDDWEDEVDAEVRREGDVVDDEPATVEEQEQEQEPKREEKKRTRIVKKLVEKPKTVYERFPTFATDKILDFTELFKGFAVKKSRITKKPFNGLSISSSCVGFPVDIPFF